MMFAAYYFFFYQGMIHHKKCVYNGFGIGLSTECSALFLLPALYYPINLSVFMVKQYFGIDVGFILIHVRFIVLCRSLRLTGYILLVHLKEQIVVVRVILIVFISGFIVKFLLNGDIKCDPLGLSFLAVEFCFGDFSEHGPDNYMSI